MDLQVEKFRVFVDHKWWRFAKPILQAKKIKNTVLVIFDYMAFPNGRPAPNLAAFDEEQKEVWVAASASASGTDAYVNFLSEEPLRVWNFAGYECELDLATGRLLKAQFTE
jgi:hypothetical protein